MLAIVAPHELAPSRADEPGSTHETPIFDDAFETSTTSEWSETVDPVYVRWVAPADGVALPDASPELALRLWSPAGVAIDPSSLVVAIGRSPETGDEIDVACSFESQDPAGSRMLATRPSQLREIDFDRDETSEHSRRSYGLRLVSWIRLKRRGAG